MARNQNYKVNKLSEKCISYHKKKKKTGNGNTTSGELVRKSIKRSLDVSAQKISLAILQRNTSSSTGK